MLLVSVVAAPYGWSFDQVVLIPVVLQVACLMLDLHDTQTAWKVAMPYIIINIVAFALRYGNIYDYWMFWYAPALLVWYLSALRWSNKAKKTVFSVSI